MPIPSISPSFSSSSSAAADQSGSTGGSGYGEVSYNYNGAFNIGAGDAGGQATGGLSVTTVALIAGAAVVGLIVWKLLKR